MQQDTGRRSSVRTRLVQLNRQRLANDLAAVLLAGLALALVEAVVVAMLFWSGWVLLSSLLPVLLLAGHWLSRSGLRRTANEVEERFTELRGRLVSVLELAEYGAERREGYSIELLQAAVEDLERMLVPLPLVRLVRRRRLVWSASGLVLAVAVLIGFRVVGGARAQVGLANAFLPATLNVRIMAEPGDTAVVPGGVVVLRCRVEPTGVFRQVVLERAGRIRDLHHLPLADEGGRISVTADAGFRYRFRVLSVSSDECRVRVMSPVKLDQLVFTCRYPAYSGLPVSRSIDATISALRGTEVGVEGVADRQVAEGRLVLGQETIRVAVAADDSSRFTTGFTVKSDAEGVLELADAEDRVMQTAAVVRVRALVDEPPFVKLFAPGRDVDMPMSMKVLLGVNSIDDFGLGELSLHYGRDSIDRRLRLKGPGGRREDTTLYYWDLSDLGLLPGEELRYYVSATDNDFVSGPKRSRSEVFTVRFPTVTEMYDAAVRQTERATQELGTQQSRQEQLGAELARVAEEMRRNRELSWEEKKALEQMLSGQEGLMEQLAELRQEVAQIADELLDGITFDESTMRQLGQLQELLSQVLPRELQQSLAELRQRLDGSTPELRRAMERFQLDQERLKAGIERALELLKKIVEEQQLEALARKAEELAELQERLTQRLGEEPAQASARMESEIGQGLDALKQGIESLADSMSDEEIGDSLAELAEEMDREEMSKTAEHLAAQMREGRTGQSKNQSRRLGQGMKKSSQSLRSLSEKLKSKRSGEAARRLAAVAGDVVALSQEQERLEGVLAGRPDLAPLAGRQMGLFAAAQVLAETLAGLASRSMAVMPQLVQELARAAAAMQSGAQAMADNNFGLARQQTEAARVSLNQTALALLDALAQAQQGGGMSGAMESLMEQLSKMAQDQMGANSEMGGIPIPLPGGLSQAQLQALARVLSLQRSVREQLRQMLENMGGTRPGLTASLDQLLEEMKGVERDLAELNVTRELVKRQESILSHLLDAQRSVRQQGFKEERESETGKAFEIRERPNLPANAGERNRLLREELMRALKAGYPDEYEEMIRRYFERLLAQ
jgi:hypothetical protein